jgi:glycosyltransferase involved in cell wall biosynthesis
LKAWDRRAAGTADRYLVNSRVVRDRVRDLYGIQAEVVPPPHGAETDGREEAVAGVDAGAVLCVARLLPYKNVGPVIEAFRELPAERLVVVGDGPLHAALQRACPSNVRLLGQVSDEQLRWLYRTASGLVAASYEDFGLTPVEAAAFGTPSAVLRWGGFLDTTIDGETGVFFDEPRPALIASAVRRLRREHWDATRLQSHAARYSREAFTTSLHRIVRETQVSGGV